MSEQRIGWDTLSHKQSIIVDVSETDRLQENCPTEDEPGKISYDFTHLFRKKNHLKQTRKNNNKEEQKKSRTPNAMKKTKNTQKGNWITSEKKLYHWFLEIYSKHFLQKQLRKTNKVFRGMAYFIKTRDSGQCRSHHQKMQKKHDSFHKILLALRTEFYDTQQPGPVKEDLQCNGYVLKESALMTEGELKRGQVRGQYTRWKEGNCKDIGLWGQQISPSAYLSQQDEK